MAAENQISKVYTAIKASLGGSGGAAGDGTLDGEIRQGSMGRVLEAMHSAHPFTADSVFLDVGSGVGKPCLHAAAMAHTAITASVGIELDVNRYAQSAAALRSVLKHDTVIANRANAYFVYGNVLNMTTFSPATHVYSFNTGMPSHVLQALVDAFVASDTAQVLCWYVDPSRMRAFTDALQSVKDSATGDVVKIPVNMSGSGEGKTAYVYTRIDTDSASEQSDNSSTVIDDDADATLSHAVELCKLRYAPALFAHSVRARCNPNAPDVIQPVAKYFEALGVDANPNLWCSLCVQAAVWGVPLWALRSAAPLLRTDGLPAQPDPMHWTLRVWPLLSAAHANGHEPVDALQNTHAPGLSLLNFWLNRSFENAKAVVRGQRQHILPLPLDEYCTMLTYIPHSLRCPDVPAAWAPDTSVPERRSAWVWLQAAASRDPPRSVLSTTVKGQDAFSIRGIAEVAALAGLWHPSQDAARVCAKYDGLHLTYTNVQTLQARTWLDDSVIDFRLRMLQNAFGSRVCSVPCHVSVILMASDAPVQNELGNRLPSDTFTAVKDAQMVLFPLHVNDNHWALCVLNMEQCTATYLDSMNQPTSQSSRAARNRSTKPAFRVIDRMTQIIDIVAPLKDGSTRAWSTVHLESPRQDNGADCGMFVVQNAMRAALGVEEEEHAIVDARDMLYARAKLALACFAAGNSAGEQRPGQWKKYVWDTQGLAH